MSITNLGGHSGCKVLLCEEDDNGIFVRKISGDIDYNKRLEIQAKKQSEFKSKRIKTPSVLKQGHTGDGLFYFDMEYIQGITMAEYLQTIEIGKVRGLVETIVHDIVSIDGNGKDIDENIFRNKIMDLKDKLSVRNNKVIDEALELLSIHSWKRFAKTDCHGDLTLENIIVKDSQLYLIDFLDSFYDNWIIDISTLMQDVQTLWAYRHEKEVNINTLIRLIVFRDILVDTVRSISDDDVMEVYYALLLKLIRIYPYTKDEHTYNFLNEKTTSVINSIKTLGGKST
nr:phosphotransferase [uncultured Acetatifactor sp.]